MNPKNRIAVYTAIYGGYDQLHRQAKQTIPTDFIAYTDKTYPQKTYHGWRVVTKAVPNLATSRLQAKWFKVNPHVLPELKHYRYLIWVDGKVVLKKGFVEWVTNQLYPSGNNLAFFTHPSRNSIIDEYSSAQQRQQFDSTDDQLKARQQIISYYRQGYPDQYLLDGTIIIRDTKSLKTMVFNKTWWQEISTNCVRDQISLPYVFWKLKTKPLIFPDTMRTNPHLLMVPHISDFKTRSLKNRIKINLKKRFLR